MKYKCYENSVPMVPIKGESLYMFSADQTSASLSTFSAVAGGNIDAKGLWLFIWNFFGGGYVFQDRVSLCNRPGMPQCWD